MLRAEPLDRFPDQHNIDAGEDGERRREACARGRVINGAAQHEIAEVDQQADKVRCEARVPGPPDAPDDAAPNAAGADSDGGEGQRNFVDGRGDGIQPEIPANQISDGREHRDVEAGEGCNGRRHVEIDDAENGALAGFIWNLEENAVQIPGQDRAGEHGQSHDDFQTHGVQPTRTISTKAKAKIVKMTLNATKTRNQNKLSANGAPVISTRLSSMAPISAGISIG